MEIKCVIQCKKEILNLQNYYSLIIIDNSFTINLSENQVKFAKCLSLLSLLLSMLTGFFSFTHEWLSKISEYILI